ncbi:MAG: chorismate mutase [Alphaproteobacteria bacterium]|nr:chorismate mutase [Alphaproteobacteria bacterium]
MSVTPSDLKGLRRRLDEIDDKLQDLLIDRTEIVSMVAASKKEDNQAAFQPAREAEIIRRLVGRHRGAFPVANLVRMWREMLAATVRLQSPFSVAVFAPADRPGCWDLARDHYGSNTPMAGCDTADQVIRAVATGRASAGVLPLPMADEADPWWPDLLSTTDDAPRIAARLPFGARGNARADTDALAIGRVAYQESGLDRTLLGAQCSASTAQARISDLLSAAGLASTLLANRTRDKTLYLIEVEGFVLPSDARLDAFRSQLGTSLDRLVSLGGYAVPLAPATLDARE